MEQGTELTLQFPIIKPSEEIVLALKVTATGLRLQPSESTYPHLLQTPY